MFSLIYQTLNSGLTIDAGVDLTGGIPEFIKLGDITDIAELFKDLNKVFKKGAYLSCSIKVSFIQLE